MSDRPFSLSDCLVFFATLSVVTVGLIGCGGTSGKERMLNNTQVRGVQQALVLFCQSNNMYYPGLTTDGRNEKAIPATDHHYGAPQASNKDISIVYAVLLSGEFLPSDFVIHPSDVGVKKPAPFPSASHTMTRANYSYAVLQFGDVPGNEGRRREWKETNNSQAPVVADRSKMIDPTLKTTGMHDGDTSGDPTKWIGSVSWNDNHVTFETSSVFAAGKIRFGSVLNPSTDDLFNGADGASPDGNAMFSY